ncbi:MAG: hypothetical protein AAGA48_32140 [Myxococcota bacterium]
MTTIVRHTHFLDGLAVHPGDGSVWASALDPNRGPEEHIVRIDPDTGETERFLVGLPFPLGVDFDAEARLHVATWNDRSVWRLEANGSGLVVTTGSDFPSAVLALDDGTLLVNNYTLGTVDRVRDDGSREGFVTEPAGFGLHDMVRAPDGTIYAGNFEDGRIFELLPQGRARPIADMQTRMGFLTWLDGNLYVTAADRGMVWRITPDGEISTFAGSGSPGHVDGPALEATFDANGIVGDPKRHVLYVGERDGSLRRIPLVAPTD